MTEEMKILDKLLSDIHSGRYDANDKLPSENELADQFKVPRMTVRKVYERLQEMGYIYSQQGKGSYVKDRQMQIPLVLSGNESFTKKMLGLGYSFRSKNIFCEEIDYHQGIYHSLSVEETDRVFKIGRLRLVNDRPIALHVSYVAKSVFDDIDSYGKKITSMFEYYQKNGFTEFASKSSLLKVIFPTKFEWEILECPCLIPLLVLETGCIDQKTGTVLEHTEIFYRSDCFNFVI
ncbi:GntR family transcriptional regulator [Bacillus alveayuensis]|uniref:GntR family transcriptional regulator n=1 Tax=Aeribacillus alveayuensis TaxID=279215 RepID=UPI0005D1239D|nr:GntR family transcriptional regulator [Bacillus alveayuensis]